MFTGPSPPRFDSRESEIDLTIFATKIVINSVAVEYRNTQQVDAILDAIPGYVIFDIYSERTSLGLVYPVFLIIAFWYAYQPTNQPTNLPAI